MIDFLVATLQLPDLPKPRSTGSQASNILDKEDTSLQPSFVKKKVSKSSVFGGFKFFSRGVESRAKSSNSKKGNTMKTYKKNIQKEIKSIASDDKQMISTLYKFKVDATAGTDAAEAIGDAKLSIETSLPGEKICSTTLKVSIQIFWMDLRLGILSKLDLLLVAHAEIYYSPQETQVAKAASKSQYSLPHFH